MAALFHLHGLLLLVLGGSLDPDELHSRRQTVDEGSNRIGLIDRKADHRGICGPRRNKEKLAECRAVGESGFEARSAFCAALTGGISGTPLDSLKAICRGYRWASIQEWANWCYWAWGGA